MRFIKLWDNIEKHILHPSNRNREWTGFEAMLDLIFMAHGDVTPQTISRNGQVFIIQRGEFAKTQRQLAEKWRWSLAKVNRYLNRLQSETFLSIKTERWFSIFRIEKYDFYNPLSERKTERKPKEERNANRKPSETLNNERKERNKEIDKEIEKKVYGSHVSLSDSEYSGLVAHMGKDNLERLISQMNDWCSAKGEKYIDYAAALRGWFRRAVEKGQMQEQKVPEPKKAPGVSEWSEEQRAIYARRKEEVFGKLNQVTQ